MIDITKKEYVVYIDWDGKDYESYDTPIEDEKFIVGEVYPSYDYERFKLICVEKEESDDYEPEKRVYYLRAIWK